MYFVPKPNKKYIKNINNKYLLSILTVSTLLLFNEKKTAPILMPPRTLFRQPSSSYK